MYIHEAIKARNAEHPYVMREKWSDTFGLWNYVRLIPSDSPDGMIVTSRAMKDPRRGWQPTAEDLTADDWIIEALPLCPP